MMINKKLILSIVYTFCLLSTLNICFTCAAENKYDDFFSPIVIEGQKPVQIGSSRFDDFSSQEEYEIAQKFVTAIINDDYLKVILTPGQRNSGIDGKSGCVYDVNEKESRIIWFKNGKVARAEKIFIGRSLSELIDEGEYCGTITKTKGSLDDKEQYDLEVLDKDSRNGFTPPPHKLLGGEWFANSMIKAIGEVFRVIVVKGLDNIPVVSYKPASESNSASPERKKFVKRFTEEAESFTGLMLMTKEGILGWSKKGEPISMFSNKKFPSLPEGFFEGSSTTLVGTIMGVTIKDKNGVVIYEFSLNLANENNPFNLKEEPLTETMADFIGKNFSVVIVNKVPTISELEELSPSDMMEGNIESDESEEQFKLGVSYYDGDGVQKDYKKAAECFQKAASKGHIGASYSLGIMYLQGQGLKQSSKEAFNYLMIAAREEVPEAQYIVGLMYYEGEGVKKNITEGIEWIRKAEQNGFEEAKKTLKEIDAQSSSGNRNESKHLEADSVMKKAEQGDTQALYNLGVMYHKGDGVKQDKKEAEKYYRMAALKGEVHAQLALGEMYDEGDGIKQNKKEAAKWYRKAAEQGDAEAQYRLGSMYYNGDGVIKNTVEGEKWLAKAVENGNKKAQNLLPKTENEKVFAEKSDLKLSLKEYTEILADSSDESYIVMDKKVFVLQWGGDFFIFHYGSDLALIGEAGVALSTSAVGTIKDGKLHIIYLSDGKLESVMVPLPEYDKNDDWYSNITEGEWFKIIIHKTNATANLSSELLGEDLGDHHSFESAQQKTDEDNLIDVVRNKMFYANYPADVGYLPVGQQLENFFESGEWSTEKNQQLADSFGTLAVFHGIGNYSEYLGITRYGGRKSKITVKIGMAQKDINNYIKKGSVIIVSIHENKNQIYHYGIDRELYKDYQSQIAIDLAMVFGGPIGAVKENNITLSDFLQTIYSVGGTPRQSSRSSSYNQPTSQNKSQTQSVSVQELVKAFEDNKYKAERDYKGKRVLITGEVYDIRTDPFTDEPYVVLENPELFAVKGVACTFTSNEREKIYDIKKGQKVTIEGTVDKVVWNVNLVNCIFIN